AAYRHRYVLGEGGNRVLRNVLEEPAREQHGEYSGRETFSAEGAARLRDVREKLCAGRAEGLERASVTQFLQALIDRGQEVVAVDIHKGWMEIDSFEDYRRAWAEVTR